MNQIHQHQIHQNQARRASSLVALAILGISMTNAAPAPKSAPILREGAAVTLRLMKPLSSKTARPGDVLDLELVKDIRVDDTLIAPEGTKVIGEVTLAKKAGRMGEGGDLAVRVIEVRAGDNRIKLRGNQGSSGDSRFAYTLAFGVFGMLKHGKNAELPAGTTIMAYVAEDVSVSALAAARTPVMDRRLPRQTVAPRPALGSQNSEQLPLDTAAILQMKAGGLSDELIVAIAAKRGLDALDGTDLIKMKAANISDGALAQLVAMSANP